MRWNSGDLRPSRPRPIHRRGRGVDMRLRSYAKVNLALSVGPAIPAGQADAGYHPIASWMHAIDLCDEIEIDLLDERASDGSIYTRSWANGSPCEWPEDADLGVRAHRLIERELNRAVPIRYAIRKRIPAGGGLGGGSSNAACVLVGLNSLLGKPIPHARLVELSRSLGSDVAFFLDDARTGTDYPPRPAIVEGLGDRIERLSPVTGNLVLILPPFGCETRAVYKAYDQSPRALREQQVRSLLRSVSGSLGLGWEPLNDLYEPACRVRPELGEIVREVDLFCGRRVHMSGSGSTLFVPMSDGSDANALVERLRSVAGGSLRVMRVALV